MIVYRKAALAAAAALLVLTGCRALSQASRPASSEALASAEASPPVPPQANQCFLGAGIAEVAYSDISELARLADAIAIAEVVHVGELQYSTEGGERPSCEYVRAAQGVFGVGRMIELQEQRNVAGSARAANTFTYWLPGGSLGGDTSAPHYFGLETPNVGDRMLAFLMNAPGDIDIGPGVLKVDAYELFAIGKDGRIETPNPDEVVTTQNVDELVDDLLPVPSGDR